MATILIIEDDIDISQGIAEYLTSKGYELDFAYNGKQAMGLLKQHTYDLILLDLNLPHVDGLDICRSLVNNQLTVVPVIIMSARIEEKDKLTGFDSGAWDYLAKPFSFAELSARISVCLARTSSAAPQNRLLQSHGITLNSDNLSISFDSKTVQLHQVGFELLSLLLESAPGAIKTSLIQQRLWGDNMPDSDPLRAHVYKLRKLLNAEFGQEFISTVRGVGYKLEVMPSKDDFEFT